MEAVGSGARVAAAGLDAMTEDEYARSQALLGETVVEAGGCYWQEVAPLFYRPLLPFKEVQLHPARWPWLGRLGGVQHAVRGREGANSWLNLLVFEDPATYSLDQLDRRERKEVMRAAGTFAVARITAAAELLECGHAVYRSFYDRTRYEYRADRGTQRRSSDGSRRCFDPRRPSCSGFIISSGCAR